MKVIFWILILALLPGCAPPQPTAPMPTSFERVLGAGLDGPKGDAIQQGDDKP